MITSLHRGRAPIAGALLALLVAGCSDGTGNNQATAPANQSAEAPANRAEAPLPAEPTATVDGKTVGGDGSPIRLDPLLPADLDGVKLPGELACSFTIEGAQQPLLLARGDVASPAPALGAVKVAGYVEEIAALGGYDAMAAGTIFSGKGKTIEIAFTGPATGGGESPPRPATLAFDRADGARRIIAGLWTCGP